MKSLQIRGKRSAVSKAWLLPKPWMVVLKLRSSRSVSNRPLRATCTKTAAHTWHAEVIWTLLLFWPTVAHSGRLDDIIDERSLSDIRKRKRRKDAVPEKDEQTRASALKSLHARALLPSISKLQPQTFASQSCMCVSYFPFSDFHLCLPFMNERTIQITWYEAFTHKICNSCLEWSNQSNHPF